MDSQLIDLLQRYLAGSADRDDLSQLTSDYDIWNAWQDVDPDIQALRDIIGELELLITEIAEGFREESELREASARVVHGYPRTPTRA